MGWWACVQYCTGPVLGQYSTVHGLCTTTTVYTVVVVLKVVGRLPTTFRRTYAESTIPGNETNIHVACRAGLDQNRVPPHKVYLLGQC